MSQPFHFRLPADFSTGCTTTHRRAENDECLSVQQLADALGLPLDLVGAALAIGETLITGRPELIDPAPSSLPN